MSNKIPQGFQLRQRKNGVHYSKPGHAPASGPCPTIKTAIKAAERNMNAR